MPEGPEVKVIAESLRKEFSKSIIYEFKFIGGRYAKHGLPSGFEVLNNALPVRITDIKHKGKFIYFVLASVKNEAQHAPNTHSDVIIKDEMFIWNTLGMSGFWSKELLGAARAVFITDKGALYFNDQRNFGTLKAVFARKETQKKLESLGIDLLNDRENIKFEHFKERLLKKRNMSKTLAEVIMDQRTLAGVGNYIKAESLYRAQLSPHRILQSLNEDEMRLLFISIRDVMSESYASNGLTITNYRDVEGKDGKFVKKVYGRKHDQLGNVVIQEETKDGRTTHWVPTIQK